MKIITFKEKKKEQKEKKNKKEKKRRKGKTDLTKSAERLQISSEHYSLDFKVPSSVYNTLSCGNFVIKTSVIKI